MKSNGPVTSNLLDGRAVVQKLQKLDLGGSQAYDGCLHIGFELNALQFQAVRSTFAMSPALNRSRLTPSTLS